MQIAFQALQTSAAQLNINLSELGIDFTPEELINKLRSLEAEGIDKVNTSVANTTDRFRKDLLPALDDTKRSLENNKNEWSNHDKKLGQINSLKNRITYFFGLTNQIMLFRRAITQALTAVKELDKAMTEIAVVTDFSVNDMWEKLPEYTRRANELGVAVKDLYNATGLYYQQGLKGNEVMKLGVETMKMARIAGMDAADATKAMTAAIRGFNLEVNETSGKRVNDVYSQLAAMTASDTEGIATAMSKTASIAYSANMELETTAALLAQIIETTQESPETAGTAMKTIIARFTEVKELFDEGMLTGKDEEGEEININRIDTALKTVGISLRDFLNGSKGIDDIFLELAQKWNTLDIATQRYIATTAAGSRQQSRFIAMMQDYDRTMELVTAANNSAGASQNQYEKTLESMETLLTKLKNAWQEFLTGIANNEVLKFGVKAITGILNVVNKLTGSLPGLIGSLAKLGIAWGALKLGSGLLSKGIDSIADRFIRQKEAAKAAENGTAAGTSKGINKGVKASIPTMWKNVKESWYTSIKAAITQASSEAKIAGVGNVPFTNSGVPITNSVPSQYAKRSQKTWTEFRESKNWGSGTPSADLKAAEKNHKKAISEYDIWLKEKMLKEQETLAQEQTNATTEAVLTNKKGEAVKIQGAASIEEMKAAQAEGKTVFLEIAGDEVEYQAAVDEYTKQLGSQGINTKKIHFSRVDATDDFTAGSVRQVGTSKTGAGAYIKSKGKGLTSGGTKWGTGTMLGGAIAGALAGGLLGNYFGKIITRGNSSTDEKVASLSTSLADFSETLSKAQETVDNLGETKKSFEELNKTLKNTKKGSAEYTSALIKNNEQFFEIQKDFDLLSNKAYYELKNGVYSITDAGWEAYSNSQILKMNQLAASKQQAQFSLASAKLEEQGAIFAEQIDLKTSEITAAEEENIENWSTGAGAVMGGIAGAIAAGATAGSLGGPIGIAIGAIAGLIVGGISAAVAGSTAYQSATEGVSIDTVNKAAIEAGKRGMTNYTAYKPGEKGYEEYLRETALRLGISSDQLNDIIQQDASAFAEHAIAAQKAAAEMLALAESTAGTSADDLGLLGDAREAYIEEYKRLYGDQDMDDLLAEYKKKVQTYFDPTEAAKNRNEKIEYDEVRGNEDEISQLKRYAEIMGYEWHPEDAENLFGEGIELPTYEEIQDALALDDMMKALEQEVLSYGENVGEAFARGLLEGTSEIGDIKLGDIKDVNDALDEQKEDIAWQKILEANQFKNLPLSLNSTEAAKLLQSNQNLLKYDIGKISDWTSKDDWTEEQILGAAYNKYMASSILEAGNKLLTDSFGNELKLNELITILEDEGASSNNIEMLLQSQGILGLVQHYQPVLEELGINIADNEDWQSAGENIVNSIQEGLQDVQLSQETKENLNAQLERLGPDIVSSFSSQIDELTINQAQILTEQLKEIPQEQASTIGELMTKVMEETGKEFDDILGLGLDPQKLYEYATALEQQNAISKEGAAAIRAYARELEALNLGFNSLTLQQARENLLKWQSQQQKIQEAELGEEIYFTQEEIDEMIAESKGRITASDFRQTAEGYIFIEGLDTLNDTLQELINALGNNIDEISEANEQGSIAWSKLGFENAYKENYEGYVIGDYSNYVGLMPRMRFGSYEDAISVMSAIAGSGNFELAAAYEREINSLISKATEGSTYYGKAQTNNYQRAIFTDADFQTGAVWTAIQKDAIQDWLVQNWNQLEQSQKDLFIRNGDSIVDNEGRLESEDDWGTFQEIITRFYTNRFWSAQDQANLQQSTASSMTPDALLKAIGSSDFAYTTSEGLIGDYAQEELDRRFEDLYGFGEDSEHFKKMYEDVFGESTDITKENINALKAHKLAVNDDRRQVYKLCDAISENSDEMDVLVKKYQQTGLQSFTDSQREAWDSVAVYAKEIFGDGMTDDFLAENWSLFQQMAEGGEVGAAAFDKISVMLTDKLIESFNLSEEKTEELKTTLSELDGLDFDIDGTADFTQIYNALYELLGNAEKVKEVLNSMGYNIEFETEKMWSRISQPGIYHKQPTYSSHAQDWVSTEIIVGTKIDSSGYSGSTNSSGGGGGSSSEWENPYDESYNTLRAINAELRERDRLEREYQHLLDKEGTSWKELLSNSYEFINNRKEEAALQEQLQQERKSQIESLVNENSEYSSYVTVDMNAGDFTIDWTAIEGLEGENLSEEEEAFRQGLEDYISALEDKFDSLYDAKEAAAEALDDIRDYVADLQDEYLNAETMIKDAIVSSYQEQIDKLSEINDSINDANSKLLDAVQSSIDQIRQDRENEKTEQELSDKERRLAYLRQDTSGANALEILELEKELEEGRQDYTDSLVDQKISQLQDQNDYAAEQRQQQIDIMTSQLEWFQESGEIFNLVSNLMEGMYGEDGKINWNSAGAQLLKDQAEAMSNMGKMKWMEDTENTLTQAAVYLHLIADELIEGSLWGEMARDALAQANSSVSYNPNADYSSIMEGLVPGTEAYEQAEALRNFKIASQGLDYDKTGQEQHEASFNENFSEFLSGYNENNPESQINNLADFIDNFLVAKHGWPAFDPNVDYMSRILSAANSGNSTSAGIWELYRNRKIDEDPNIDSAEKTYAFWRAIPWDWYLKNINNPFDYIGPAFKTGGLADFTGPAWLDGTKSRPEMVLNQRDTQNFIQLKDILSGLLGHGSFNSSETNGDVYYNIDINVERISSDYDIDEVVNKIKQTIYEDASYRNVNAIHLIR